MKQIVPIVLTALMMASLFAGIDFVDELKDTNEMETGGRAAYELNLHDVLQPRETFVDAAGNTRNGIDIGDVVYFRPIIINEGDNADEIAAAPYNAILPTTTGLRPNASANGPAKKLPTPQPTKNNVTANDRRVESASRSKCTRISENAGNI